MGDGAYYKKAMDGVQGWSETVSQAGSGGELSFVSFLSSSFLPFFCCCVCVWYVCLDLRVCVSVGVCVCLFLSFLSFFLFFLHWDRGSPHKGLYRGVWWGRAWWRSMWIHGRQGAATVATGWPGSCGSCSEEEEEEEEEEKLLVVPTSSSLFFLALSLSIYI